MQGQSLTVALRIFCIPFHRPQLPQGGFVASRDGASRQESIPTTALLSADSLRKIFEDFHLSQPFFLLHAQVTLKEFLCHLNKFFRLCLAAQAQSQTFETFSRKILTIPIQRPQNFGTVEFSKVASSSAAFVSGARFSELLTTTPGQQDGSKQGFENWDLLKQRLNNKLMHILNGNTTIHLEFQHGQLFW